MATTDTQLTAEEYGRLPENGRPTELVRGRIVEMNVVTAFDADRPGRTLRGDDELTFPVPLAELRIAVRRLFP